MKFALPLAVSMLVSSISSISHASTHLKIPFLASAGFGKIEAGGCASDDGTMPVIVQKTLDLELKDVGPDSVEGNAGMDLMAPDGSQIDVSLSHFEKKNSKNESYRLINIARDGKPIAFSQMKPVNNSSELVVGGIVYLDQQKCLVIAAGINPQIP